MSRASIVADIAPVAPGCFSTRSIWLEYLSSAAEESRLDHKPGPIIFAPGKAPVFNYQFSFCDDCCAQHSFEMERQGLCHPDYLRSLGSLAALAHRTSEALRRNGSLPFAHPHEAMGGA